MSEELKKEIRTDGKLYTPKKGELQFTVRAIVIGCIIGGVVNAFNLYIGLKIGWSFGASILTAILAYTVFNILKPTKAFTVSECNISQTAGSAAGSMASASGLLAAIPALKLLGHELPIYSLMLWSVAVAFLGVMFAVPLRRQYIEVEKLKFPSGLATANTIVAIFASAKEALEKARYLFIFAAFAFAYAILAHFYPVMEFPPVETWLASGSLTILALWGFKLYISPMMFGGGFLIGPRIGLSLLGGSIVGWGIGYYVQQIGWAPHENPMKIYDNSTGIWGARGWILWPGVAIMVGDALMSLGLSWKTFIRAFQGTTKAFGNSSEQDDIPTRWWVGGLAIAGTATVIIASTSAFGIPWYLTLLAIVLSFILANVAVRASGETDINPVGGMGKVTQGVFGALTSSMKTNLLAAGITGAGASQASDMMHDLKTGHLLNASPKKQFKAQLWGILSGIFFAVPIYYLFDKAWDIGAEGSPLPAPAAQAWKAVAEIMSKGFSALPQYGKEAIFIGLAFGALLSILRSFKTPLKEYIPSGIAMGIAFIVPAFYSMTMCFGALFYYAWNKKSPISCEKFAYPIACGVLAGEGVAGIVNAIIDLTTN